MRWESPYLPEGKWLKGNLHTHTTVSDGGFSLPEVIQAYRDNAKYDFIAITDHTNAHAKPHLYVEPESTPAFSVLRGREDSYGRHVVGVGCPMTFHEDEIGKEALSYSDSDNQRVVDKIVRQGGLAYLAHPHWKRMDYWSAECMLALENVTGLEIINGDRFTPVANLATDVWDQLLTSGKRIWGVGTDDCHSPMTFSNAWTMVYAKSNTPADILDALSKGSCYASNGAAFESLHVEGDWIVAECATAPWFSNCEKTFRFIGRGGVVAQRQIGKNGVAAYKAVGDEQYIRVELSLDWGYAAFSQPFFRVDKG